MTIPAVKYNDFVINQGADWEETLGFMSGETDIVMTGWAISFTAKTNVNAEDYVIDATIANNKIVLSNDAKSFTIKLSEIETAGIAAGRYDYNLTSVDTNGNTVRRMEGTLHVSAGI